MPKSKADRKCRGGLLKQHVDLQTLKAAPPSESSAVIAARIAAR